MINGSSGNALVTQNNLGLVSHHISVGGQFKYQKPFLIRQFSLWIATDKTSCLRAEGHTVEALSTYSYSAV